MAQEFNIPGLKESIADISKFHEEVAKLSKDLLDSAINAEKMVKSVGGAGVFKDFIETQKKANETQKESSKIADEIAKKEKLIADAKGELGKKLAVANLELQKANKENKDYAKSQDDSRSALEKFNAKIAESTKLSKDLGAQMVFLELEGKKNTKEYKDLEKAFLDASKTSKQLNDSYRDISKTAGDNRALVGSYSSELKGHFDMINGSITSLKGNISSGNWSGAFNDARTVVKGFGEAIQKSTTTAKEFGGEMKNNGGVFATVKQKVSETGDALKKSGQSLIEFFKPSQENSSKMAEGLERVKIGFQQVGTANKTTSTIQAESTAVNEVANASAQKGTVFTNLYAGAKLLFAGATGVATGALVVFGTMMAALGIGAIIAAVALLGNYLAGYRPLMNALKDGFAGVGAVVEMLTDKIGKFITGIQSFGDLASKLGNMILHPIDSIKSIGAEMSKTAIEGAKLNESTRKLTAAQKDYAIESKNVENQIKSLMLQARNRTTSEEDRIKILKKVKELEEGMHNKKVVMWQQEMDLNLQKLKNEGKITDAEIALLRKGDQAALASFKARKNITSGEIDNFREIMQKKADIDGEGITVRERSTNMMDGLADKAEKKQEDRQKKAEEAAKKALEHEKKQAEEAIKTMKLVLDYQIESYDKSEHLEDENFTHVEAISKMKSAIAIAEMQKNLIGVKKGSDEEISIRNANKQELEKIELEKQKAILSVQQDAKKIEIELYDMQTTEIMSSERSLTDRILDEQIRRLDESLKKHKDFAREKYKIDKDLSDQTLKLWEKEGRELTENQKNYLKDIKAEEKSVVDAKKKQSTEFLGDKKKTIDDEEKAENRKFNLYNKNTIAQAVNASKTREKTLKEDKKILLEEQKNLKQGTKEYKENAKKIEDIDNEVADNKQKIDELVTKSKIEGLQASLAGLIDFAGKESAVGKAAAVAQATVDTYVGANRALKDYPAPYSGIVAGLTIAMGLRNVTEIMGIQAFEVGTDYAPYTGLALVDEAGAEIHTDKFGNIKSMGSNSGAHLTNITQGDRIIPADISSLIMQSMALNFKDKNQIDYDKIGEQFGRHAGKIISAISNKKEASLNVMVQRNISDRVIFKGKNI